MSKRRKQNSGGPSVKKKKVEQIPVANEKEIYIKKRRRTRTTGLRKQLMLEIEKAVKTVGHPIGNLFQHIDNNGIPYANFNDAISLLNVDHQKVLKISKEGLLKLNNLTVIFEIKEYSPNQLVIEYIPTGNPTEATVYIDNLPLGCNGTKLMKLLRKYGNVVEVKMSLQRRHPLSLSDHPRCIRFAFVQFTENEAAESLRKKYINNAPGKSIAKTLTMVSLLRRIKRLKTIRRHQGGKFKRYQLLHFRSLQINYKRNRSIHIRYMSKIRRRLNSKHERRNRRSDSFREKRTKRKVKRQQRSSSDSLDIPWRVVRRERKEKRQKIGTEKRQLHVQRKAERAKAIAEKLVVPKKLRFRRRRRNRGNQPGFINCSTDDYFENIQVISYSDYMDLRRKYLETQELEKAGWEKDAQEHNIQLSDTEAVAYRDQNF